MINISKETCKYKGEGNASLVMSVKVGKEDKVLRIIKDEVSNISSKSPESVFKELEDNIARMKNVMCPLLGENIVYLPSIVFLSVQEVKMLNDISKNDRPAHRVSKVVKEKDTYALLLPDFCTLPKKLDSYATTGPVISVEIKPKQGFLQKFSHPDIASKPRLCTFCMMQYQKLKKGMVAQRSGYCPLDLFSGCPERMKYSIKALLKSPQNNIRVFKNGELIYSEEKRGDISSELESIFHASSPEMYVEDRLSYLITQALLKRINSAFYSHSTNKIGLQNGCANSQLSCTSSNAECPHKLPETCILDRIIRIQLFDSMDINEIQSLCLQLKTIKKTSNDPGEVGVLNSSEMPPHLGNEQQALSESEVQFMSRKVWEFLLALTMKDCSIMLTFKRLSSGCQSSYESLPEENVITDVNGAYLFSLALIDLDTKPLVKVEKVCKDRQNIVEAYLQSK